MIQRLMISASNMPLPQQKVSSDKTDPLQESGPATTLLLLPSFLQISPVPTSSIPTLITHVINPSSTNITSPSTVPSSSSSILNSLPSNLPFTVSSSPHSALILLCSHTTRDARCGQSAPLLKREFERHLRPLGLQRDLDDERPGGVGILFINHVGGHKFSANVIIYRRAGFGDDMEDEMNGMNGGFENGEKDGNNVNENEAVQGIWLARVRPEDCENIVRYTVLKGKVVKPERQLRGGFDRAKGMVSW